MSVEAITWALRQPISHSSAKFVLVVMSNCASADTFICFPSVAYLADATGQDRKTVMTNIERLREWGYIEDTGKRAGATKQIPVYRIICGGDLFQEGVKRDSSENGTVPKTDGNSTENGGKGSRKGDTETSGNSNNRQSYAQRSALRFPEFWSLYPKRVGKADCLKKWKSSKLDAKADTILAALRLQIAQDARWADGFIPDPHTYLNGKRWEDEIQRKADPQAPAAPTPAAAAKRDPRTNSESPLENELRHVFNQHRLGAYGEGPEADAERDRLFAAARRKHAPAEEPADA